MKFPEMPVFAAWSTLVLRIAFGIILLYAAYDKILDPHSFAEAIENYDVAGPRLSRWLAIWIPYLEAITGILLISGRWLDGAALSNFLMMSVFFIAVSQAYLRGLDINCGCFSEAGRINIYKILYNSLLLAGSAFLLFLRPFFRPKWPPF